MGLFFTAFLLLPLVDMIVLFRIGGRLGGANVLMYVLAMMFVGSWLARSQGRRVIEHAQGALARGEVPESDLLGGLLVLAGGILLMIPGVLTDVVGLLFLLPLTRRWIGASLARQLQARVASGGVQSFRVNWPGVQRPRDSSVGFGPPRGTDVIDTEGEDITDQPR